MTKQPHYKQSLIEVREMLSGVDLFEIARKLTMVFEDEEFWSDSRARDLFDAAEHLDRELASINVDFLELYKALELFPNKDDWSGWSIREILKEAKKFRQKRAVTSGDETALAAADESQYLLFDDAHFK